MKIFSFITLLLFPSIGWAGTVESDRFILRDQYGQVTAELTESGEGTPGLFFYDARGVARISIGLYSDGVPGIVLNDEKGLATAILRMVNNQGGPVLVLKENGQDKIIIDTDNTNGKSTSSSLSYLSMLIIGLFGGLLGGRLGNYFGEKKGDHRDMSQTLPPPL